MRQFADNAGRLTAVGLALLAATALSLMLTIERTFNAIWRVHAPRPFVRQMLIYWAMLTVGPLLLGGGLSALGRHDAGQRAGAPGAGLGPTRCNGWPRWG